MNNFDEVRVEFDGLSFTTHLSSLNEIREIFLWNVYEPHFRVGHGSTVVDVGANAGIFTLKSGKAGARRIIAVEPHPDNFDLLVTNLERNRQFLPAYYCFPVALAHKNGPTTLHIGPAPGSHSLVSKVGAAKSIQVEARTLDSIKEKLVEEHGAFTINFIKIDVEGAAGHVLRGATKILKEDKPVIGVAIYHTPLERDEVLNLLLGAGYEVEFFNGVGDPVKTMQESRFIQAYVSS